ncbi:MAG: hypothetical protein HQM10_18090 [Candidatus Riflebacteria bacterium]|nr:hypothetical protein [Candidatus Riflebacteria bacterium]
MNIEKFRLKFIVSVSIVVILMMSDISAAESASQPEISYENLIRTFKFPEKFESAEMFLEYLVKNNINLWSQTQTPVSDQTSGTTIKSPAALRATRFPWMASTAIADYREALRKEFIAVVGTVDGLMNSSQLSSIASKGRLPGNADSSAYLTVHDKNTDGSLSIEEFVPSAEEISRTIDLVLLTNSFTHGIPYPSGQSPMSSAVEFGISTSGVLLFATPDEIETRVRAYASRIGGSTFRDPLGRLAVKDANGQPVFPLPPEIIPLTKQQAETELRNFLNEVGGTGEFSPSKAPVLRGSDGKIIPIEKWPPYTQPPYHPPVP